MRRRTALGVLVTAGMLSGCGLFGGGDDGSGAGGAVGSVASMLSWVPDTTANRGRPIFYANADRSRHDLGTRSTDWLFDLTLPTAYRSQTQQPGWSSMSGFELTSVDASVEFGELPAETAILVGDFHADAVTAAMRTAPGGDALAVAQQDGATVVDLPSMATMTQGASPLRLQGEPVYVALLDQGLVRSEDPNLRSASLDAHRGTAPSLATDEQYGSIAAQLDAAEVVNAAMVTAEKGWGWEIGGVGDRFGDTDTVTVALAYRTADEASAAVDAFRAHIERDRSYATGQQWSKLLEVTDAKVVGRVLVVTLTATSSGLGVRSILTEDNLLVFQQ